MPRPNRTNEFLTELRQKITAYLKGSPFNQDSMKNVAKHFDVDNSTLSAAVRDMENIEKEKVGLLTIIKLKK